MDVPDLVVQRATNSGGAGQRWLEELPGVVAELADRWNLTLGRPFLGGTAGYVVAATDTSGRECVLKISMPLDDDATFRRSVRAHELAAGRGCAELLAHDLSSRAMLLERLGPNLAELGFTVPEILDAIADTLRTFWRPVADGAGLRTGHEQAAWLARFIVETWGELGEPCDRAIIDCALSLCRRRADAFDPSRSVLVHGDAHGWNTVAAGPGVYKLVDAEGLWSEREHDLGVAMREYNEPLLQGATARLVEDRARALAQHCGVDARAVWEWGFIERVSTGLAVMHALDDGDGDGERFLEVARRCL